MPWIRLHSNLRNHPKLEALCLELRVEKAEAMGLLTSLWTWALDYAEDGDLSRFQPEIVERGCEWKGEPNALFSALLGKFIDSDLKIHDWLDYAGSYLRSKYHTSNPKKLKQIQRLYKVKISQTKLPLKSAFSQTDKIRLDKIRLDKNKNPPIPPLETKNLVRGVFDFWNSKKIIIHREVSSAIEGRIKSKLKNYSVDEIQDAILNYAKIMESPDHWPAYKWTLEEFLGRGNGFVKYITENKPFDVFKNFEKPNSKIDDLKSETEQAYQLVKEAKRRSLKQIEK